MKKLILLPILVVLAASCNQKPKEFKPNLGTDVSNGFFGPQQGDTNLAFGDGSQSISAKHQYMKSDGLKLSGDVLYLSKTLMEVAKQEPGREEIGLLGKRIVEAFHAGNETVSKKAFVDSHLIQAVLKEIYQGFDEGAKGFEGQTAIVAEIIQQVVNQHIFTDWATYMDKIDAMVDGSRIAVLADERVSDSVKESIDETFTRYLNDDLVRLRSAIDAGLASNSAITILNRINTELIYFEHDLTPEAEQNLTEVGVVANAISVIVDAQDALTATVKLWRFTDDEGKLKFKDENGAFYFLIKDADDETLDCLEQRDPCSGILMGFYDTAIKQGQILPGFVDEGPANTKASLDQKVSEGIREEMWTTALDVGGSFVDGVVEAFDEKEATLAEVTTDILTAMTPAINQFAATELAGAKYSHFENKLINFTVDDSTTIQSVGFAAAESSDTSAQVFGTGLSALAAKWNNYQADSTANITQHRVEVLGALNKMLSMGGYTRADGSVYDGIARATVDPSVKTYDLNNTDAFNLAFAISNSESINGQTTGSRSIDIGHQAAVLEGLVDMMSYLRDWEENSFQTAFHGLKASQIMTPELAELAGEEGDQAFIKKEDMYSLAVGQAAIFLKSLSFLGSPLVLITADGGYEMISSPDTADQTDTLMVAAVGWTDSQRDSTIQVRDVADFLYAMTKMYHAIGDMENTQSEALLDIKDGPSGLEQLREARNDSLKSLILGMASFLVGKAQDSNGAIAETVSLGDWKKTGVGSSVRTQARTIRALVAASNVLGTDVYSWGAQDIYFFMNKNAWKSDLHFYQLDDEFDLFLMADTIHALTVLKPELPEQSQGQLDTVLARWVNALRTF